MLETSDGLAFKVHWWKSSFVKNGSAECGFYKHPDMHFIIVLSFAR